MAKWAIEKYFRNYATYRLLETTLRYPCISAQDNAPALLALLHYTAPVRSLFLALFVLTMLSGCTGPSTQSEIHGVRGASLGTLWTQRLLHAGPGSLPTRPSALMGVYMGMYLAPSKSAVAGAKHGVETMRYAIEHIGIDVDFAPVFELLTQFGAILQIDVPDMLNRNAFRAEALEEYTFTLGEFIEEAKREKAQLEVQKEEASDERRERRKEVTSLEKEARTAEREKNFAHVGEVQQALVGAKASAAEAEAKAEQISSLINAMEDLLEVAEERKTAIEQNREVLIAGLHIVEVPGIEDLQIINEKQRKSFSFGKSQQ